MSTQVDSKPSAVLIESYNERMSKFLLPESVYNATVVIGETDSNGVAIATITIPGEKTITTKVKRSSLESTVPLTSVDELDGGKFMRLVMEDQTAIESAASDIKSAMGFNSSEDVSDLTTEQAMELELNVMFSAAIWVNHGIFVPPLDFTWVNTTDEYSERLANNDSIQSVFEMEAKPNSLGFVGGVKGVTLARAITVPSESETTEVEWSIVEFEITSPEDIDNLADPDNYVVSTKTGLITTDKPQFNFETASGWLSAANYTLKEGETVRIKIPSSVIGDMFRMPSLVDSGITGVTEPKDIYYPFKDLTAPSNSINPYSLVWSVEDGYYIVHVNSKLTSTPDKPTMYGYEYLPSEGEMHYVDYTYREGVVTININGIHTQSYTTNTPIVMIPLSTGVATFDLGGVESFTSEYITDVDDVIARPTWAMEDEPDTRSIEELPTTVFTPRGDVDGVVNDISIQMDILKTGKWSLRDSSGLEILGMDSGVQETEYLVSRDISRFKYTNIRPVLTTDMLTAGETYTLFADLNSLTFTSNGDATDGIDFTALPEGIKCLRFGLSNRELTVPTVMPSSLTNMSRLFSQSRVFNQDVTDWDMSNVTDTSSMFEGNQVFNQDISGWNVSNVTNFDSMFAGTKLFDCDISGWDMSGATNVTQMFRRAQAFNQDISNWDMSNVTKMGGMFFGARIFNQPIGSWNISKVTELNEIFRSTEAFNQPLNTWDTSNVVTLDEAFANALAFDQPLDLWDTSKVRSMTKMFAGTPLFNQDISGWDTGNVTNMIGMFEETKVFNQDISNWNVSNVRDMKWMFLEAKAFNQDLSQWCVSTQSGLPNGFDSNTPSWTLPKPAWGTCPRGEDGVTPPVVP